MATKSEKERLAVIEEQMVQNKDEHKEIKIIVENVAKDIKAIKENTASKSDLKIGLSTKADKEDFEHVKVGQSKLNDRLWYVVITIVFMLMGGIAWFAKQYIMLRGL